MRRVHDQNGRARRAGDGGQCAVDGRPTSRPGSRYTGMMMRERGCCRRLAREPAAGGALRALRGAVGRQLDTCDDPVALRDPGGVAKSWTPVASGRKLAARRPSRATCGWNRTEAGRCWTDRPAPAETWSIRPCATSPTLSPPRRGSRRGRNCPGRSVPAAGERSDRIRIVIALRDAPVPLRPAARRRPMPAFAARRGQIVRLELERLGHRWRRRHLR